MSRLLRAGAGDRNASVHGTRKQTEMPTQIDSLVSIAPPSACGLDESPIVSQHNSEAGRKLRGSAGEGTGGRGGHQSSHAGGCIMGDAGEDDGKQRGIPRPPSQMPNSSNETRLRAHRSAPAQALPAAHIPSLSADVWALQGYTSRRSKWTQRCRMGWHGRRRADERASLQLGWSANDGRAQEGGPPRRPPAHRRLIADSCSGGIGWRHSGGPARQSRVRAVHARPPSGDLVLARPRAKDVLLLRRNGDRQVLAPAPATATATATATSTSIEAAPASEMIPAS